MHYSEDDLILYYYGEHRRRVRVERHLDACADCRAAYESLVAALTLVPEPVAPERGDQYGLEVWQRIRARLPEQEPPWWAIWASPRRLAPVAAAVLLIAGAFAAGRTWPRPAPTVYEAPAAAAADGGNRVLLAAVGDHLAESERVLLEFLNADPTRSQPADVSAPQQWASDLIAANRLYRDASSAAGDEAMAAVLDELERSLLDLAHGPARLTTDDVERARGRLDAGALLFRLRVLADDLRERERASPEPGDTI